MKVECPACHLSGTINELEIPSGGRTLECPRCRERIPVAKPPPPAGAGVAMNICPSCNYSTFTEETFTVCPKCGLVGGTYHANRLRQEEPVRSSRLPEPAHDALPLQRSRSFDDPENIVERVESSPVVRSTGWACIVGGGALFCYGAAGLVNYYRQDWRAILSEPLQEPLSATRVFFDLGFVPWVLVLFSAWFIGVSVLFLGQRTGALRSLILCSWGGVAVGVVHELSGFIRWMGVSSSSPSLTYYAVGILGMLFTMALWVAPFLGLNWYLRQESIGDEFPDD